MSLNSPHSNRAVTTQAPGSDRLYDGREPIGLSSAALTLLTSVLWGGTPVAISYSVHDLPPISVAAIRFVFAAMFMACWCRWEGTELRLRSGQVTPVLIAGGILFFQIGLFHVGIAQSNSSHASLIVNSFVIWVALIGHFVTRNDRLTLWKFLGLALAVSGIAVVLTTTSATNTNDVESVYASASSDGQEDVATLSGDFLLLGSAVLLGIKLVYTKFALRTVEPGKLILWHNIVGVVLFAIYSTSFEEFTIGDIHGPAVWGLLYQGFVVAGFCFAVQANLLRKHLASQLAVFSFTTPLFGILLAYLFRGDRLSPWLWVSGLFVAVGILMVNTASPVWKAEPKSSFENGE